MWCDAMLVLIHDEWPKARWNLVNLSTQSTHNAIQAWMQATQVQVRVFPVLLSFIALRSSLSSCADPAGFLLYRPAQVLVAQAMLPLSCSNTGRADNRRHLIPCSLAQDLMGSRSPMDEAEDGMPGAAGVSASANAAKRMVQAVQQFVAMLQIHLVRGGPSLHVTIGT